MEHQRRAVFGAEPPKRAGKNQLRLYGYAIDFIARSPFLVLSTAIESAIDADYRDSI